MTFIVVTPWKRSRTCAGLSLCLFFVLSAVMATSVGADYYNSYQAVRYADKWVDPNEKDKSIRNKFFHDYTKTGGDCANYVSQCLMAGYIRTYLGACEDMHSIHNCDNLNSFLRSLGITPHRVDSATNPPDDIVAGDVVIFGVFGTDEESTGDEYDEYAHAAIVTYRSGTTILINSHTSERYHHAFGSILNGFDFATCYHIPSNAGVTANLAPSLNQPLVLSSTPGSAPQTPLYVTPCYTYADMRIGNYIACDIPDTIYVRLYYYTNGGWTLVAGPPLPIRALLYDQTGAVEDYAILIPATGDQTIEMSVDDIGYWAETNEYDNVSYRTDTYEDCDNNPEICAQDFEATPECGAITLSWVAKLMPDLTGFRLYGGPEGQEPVWLAEVPANGTAADSCAEQHFRYVDRSVKPGMPYAYRLDVAFTDGTTWPIATAEAFLPGASGILSSCLVPNPFSNAAHIRFEMSTPGEVSIAIFDVSGRIVRTFPNEWREAGEQSLIWDGRDDGGSRLAPGLYLCHLCRGRDCRVEKTVLIR
ncbi:MAG: amidase domain-containing protein [Candidatus Eisenbacteria bacterium]|nr:amidase domain-containing protein [Candidatus Eisenbacteria bacterium]